MGLLLFSVSLIKSGFDFSSCPYGVDILYSGTVFSHATLKNDFVVLDLNYCYKNLIQSLSHSLILI